MRREDEKFEFEKAALKRLIDARGLSIDVESIEKRYPPEPDLLCHHQTEGMIAFELVEICNPDIAQILADPREGVQVLWTENEVKRIINAKLGKTYKTPHPIELICYLEGRSGIPDSCTLPTIQLFTEAKPHPFRRVWLLGRKDAYLAWEAG